MPWTICSFALLLALLPVVGQPPAPVAVVVDAKTALYDEDALVPRPVASVRAELMAGGAEDDDARWLQLTISAFGPGVDPVPGLAGVSGSNLRTAEELDRLLREDALRLVVRQGGEVASDCPSRIAAIDWRRVPQRAFGPAGVEIVGVEGSPRTSARRWPATVTFRTATLPTGGALGCYLEADGLPRLLVEIEGDRVARVASLGASQEETR